MSLHTFPSPAPHREGERETVGRHGETSASAPFYVQQMQDLLLAAEVIPGLSSAQYETLMVYSRGFYYACRKFYGVASRPWAEMSRKGNGPTSVRRGNRFGIFPRRGASSAVGRVTTKATCTAARAAASMLKGTANAD
jgi:hypothetical protein